MNFVNNLRHPPWLEVADLARSGRDSPGNRLRPPGSQGAGLGAGAGFSKKKSLSWAVLSSLGLTLGRRACAAGTTMLTIMALDDTQPTDNYYRDQCHSRVHIVALSRSAAVSQALRA